RESAPFAVGALFPKRESASFAVGALFPKRESASFAVGALFPKRESAPFAVGALFPKRESAPFAVGALFPKRESAHSPSEAFSMRILWDILPWVAAYLANSKRFIFPSGGSFAGLGIGYAIINGISSV
ncbi:MAG: hypothetical protein MJZ85_06565, partial [Bacteroidales bacterium]|nr:hypothetical protein [Bacteroidales bacterium]